MTFMSRFLALLAAMGTAGCSGVDAVNALTPRSGYAVTHDIAYGEGPRRQLDIYVPDKARDAPVLVFFYGGSWASGSKNDYRFAGQAYASRGYVVVIPDYRLYPEVRYPAFLQDGASAVRWVHDNIRRYGGDPRLLFLAGHSAGGYNAMMLGLDRRWLGEQGLDADRTISGIVGLAGPYDFLPIIDPEVKIIFGPPDTWPATQPIRYVHPGAPPVFLAAGTTDDTVDPGNAPRLAARLRADRVPVQVTMYKGLGHIGLAAALAFPLRFLAPVLRDSVAFLDTAVHTPRS